MEPGIKEELAKTKGIYGEEQGWDRTGWGVKAGKEAPEPWKVLKWKRSWAFNTYCTSALSLVWGKSGQHEEDKLSGQRPGGPGFPIAVRNQVKGRSPRFPLPSTMTGQWLYNIGTNVYGEGAREQFPNKNVNMSSQDTFFKNSFIIIE